MNYRKVGQSIVLSALFLPAFLTSSNTYSQPLICSNTPVDECFANLSWSTLIQWADDWSKGDVIAYLSHYDTHTSPVEGLSREQWLSKRTNAVSKARDISINLKAIDIQILPNNQARITVIQHYAAHHYSDIVLKTFVFILYDDNVKILSESVDRKLSEQEAATIIEELG